MLQTPNTTSLFITKSFVLFALFTASIQAQTTTPALPHKSVKTDVPTGYEKITVAGRSLICLPDDKIWITEAASRIKSDLGPTTRPADLLNNLTNRRDQIVAGFLKNLPSINPSQIDELIDQKLIPDLKISAAIKPQIVYLVTPSEHLKAALRAGWTDNKIKLNRVTDTLELDLSVALIGENAGNESTVVALFSPGDSVQQRTTLLTRYITSTEQQLAEQIAGRSVSIAIAQIADFIAAKALKDLPRQEDQVWLVNGLSNVLAARYVSLIHGAPVPQFIEAMIVSPKQTPVSAATLDLLNPIPLTSLREEFVQPHLDARRRKSIAVMYIWYRQAGDDQLLPLIEAITRSRPADGATLVRVINDVSKIDLSDNLKPR